MDFIGDLGGVPGVIEYVIIFIFGGYLSFNTSFTTMLSLYKPEDDGHVHSDQHEGGSINVSFEDRFVAANENTLKI